MLADGAAVGDLLDELGIPADEDLIVGVDGVLADRSTALADGTQVMLVTPMSGGRPAERTVCPLGLC